MNPGNEDLCVYATVTVITNGNSAKEGDEAVFAVAYTAALQSFSPQALDTSCVTQRFARAPRALDLRKVGAGSQGELLDPLLSMAAEIGLATVRLSIF
jgi:hypothetical protein